jgi:D-alanyl-D-alanine carboxypeptidase
LPLRPNNISNPTFRRSALPKRKHARRHIGDRKACSISAGPNHKFFIGSVRKVFTVGELLNEVGPEHSYDTPVYRHGAIDCGGVLKGDLILVASGDLTMGGRTNPDGSIAVSGYDHNEADSLGNAVLTKPNPLAGYEELAHQIARSGIKEITGDVIIDDRLFQPFNFRGEFDAKPIFVNDDVVDLTINPTKAGELASVESRPVSPALGIENRLITSEPGSESTLKINPILPQCIGEPGCVAEITGQLPVDFIPPLTNKNPLVQTVRIVDPSDYARTVFIEELKKAGVRVDAPLVAENPVRLLPPKDSYSAAKKMAELRGLPYSEDAKLILKVSYNIGADTSLLLFGLTQGVDNQGDALEVERANLSAQYGIRQNEYHFVDGSGGGPTTATNPAVTRMLLKMTKSHSFPAFFDSLPILGVDGSLNFVTDFESDPTLAGAKGQVRAKTGTFAEGSESGLLLKGQAFGGYITTKRGRRLAYELVVNNVNVTSLDQVIQVFQDEGRISAILWRDN